ncbi:hypothetical protein KR018_006910 [Drosophila ironensis]|nr:hypothetical protein KR018_006910 [Drosophila ironensis]
MTLYNDPSYFQNSEESPTDEPSSSRRGDSSRIRNVLGLEERVAAIRQYDIVPMYSKIARNFNCSWEQIKSIIQNRDSILRYYEATSKMAPKPVKDGELRKRQLRFLGHCLYEYIQRAQYYLLADITEDMIRNKAIEFRNLMRLDGFVPSKPWLNHFKAEFNITLSNRQINMNRRPPRAMDLKDIMSYCGRTTAAECISDPPSTDASASTSTATTTPDRPLYRTKTLVAASIQNQAICDEVQLRRKRKIAFLETCLYEYILRSQIHLNSRMDIDMLRKVAISLRDILKIDNFFPDKTWFNHFKNHYNFSFSVGVRVPLRRVPLSLDLRDIVSYCVKHGNGPPSDEEQEAVPGDAETEDKATEEEDDDDDCIPIEVKPELIEIKDEDEDEDEDDDAASTIEFEISPKDVKRKLEDDSSPLPLKIQKIQSLNENAPADVELPPAHSPGHYSEDSDEATMPTCVESYKDALRLLKPLEDFALMEENYRAIGLLTQLETIFQAGVDRSASKTK